MRLRPKHLAMAVLGALAIGVVAAPPAYRPARVGAYYSTDGTGADGTWSPMAGSGSAGPPVGRVEHAGMYYSSDGTGNDGTWLPCGTNCFANGSGTVSTGTAGQVAVYTGPTTVAGSSILQSVPSWLQFLGDGSEGALSVTSGTTSIAGEHWYSSVNVSAGATLNSSSQSPAMIVRSTGACTIAGTVSFAGAMTAATNYGGAGGGGGGGAGVGSAGNSGGVFTVAGSAGAIAGIGGAGNATPASDYKLVISGFGPNPSLITAGGVFTPFGGAKGGAGGSSGGAGGAGGGGIILVCGSMSFTGTVDVSGANGGASTGNNIGAGGGGGGGFVIMRSPTWSANTGTINVAAGSGGSCGAFTGCGAGGAGGAGWSTKILQ